MIQEEIPVSMLKMEQQTVCHPQISVSDVLGSEVTLVAGSDTSEDSMDSLDNQKGAAEIKSAARSAMFFREQPKLNQPPDQQCQDLSIGCTPQHNTSNEFFLRRNSDKSSCYSDDSLSNDSFSLGNQSPSSSSNTQSSHGGGSDMEIRTKAMESYEKMQINHELNKAGTQNFQIFRNLNLTLEIEDGTSRSPNDKTVSATSDANFSD
ncbi:Kinase associated domain 1 [Popillia japonica]|uniref:Kinase associated domain 1 n=1 Tax=Popillia japonica TaxID=7064 RepID=A0AAW1N5D8_POPJA